MLELEGVSVCFGPIHAVREVSFSLKQGQVFSLVGPNGAGKTTTLRAISGLTPLAKGRILFQGSDIGRVPAHKRVEMGLVHVPEGRMVLSTMSVLENLELGGYTRPRAETARGIEAMFARFPILGSRSDQPAGALSGGEQQMLAIARALLAKPKVLLMDEPSLGLAPLVVKDVLRIVTELAAEGLTILLVEQNARAALAVSDEACVLENGRIALRDTADALRCNPKVEEYYLGGGECGDGGLSQAG